MISVRMMLKGTRSGITYMYTCSALIRVWPGLRRNETPVDA